MASRKSAFAWGVAADDSGTQRGEFLAPDLWAEMIKPHYARLCQWVHANTNWKTFFHSCGSIYNLIPHMIEAGIDILNPVQVNCKGMEDTFALKKEFGRDLTFWGGSCDNAILAFGSPAEVREETKRRIDSLAPGGGFIFAPIHIIQSVVPVKNLIAWWETFQENNTY